jgi:hypothetical protein
MIFIGERTTHFEAPVDCKQICERRIAQCSASTVQEIEPCSPKAIAENQRHL